MSEPSLEAIHLTKRFNSFVALDDLNLKVSGAKCVGFLGPNGAGKTTTLKLFSDMIFATKGQALINGLDVHASKRRALDCAGVLVETPEIYPAMSPRDALSLIAEIRGIPAAERQGRIETVLGEVAMSEWIDKRIGEFSKGMKQRVNIAAVLLPDPQIVILDEPTTGLDPRGMAEVRDVIRDLKRRQKLVFMSSHLLGEVADVCDEVAMINRGKLLVYDSLERVMTRTNTARTIVEVGFSRAVDATGTKQVTEIPGVEGVDRLDTLTLQLTLSPGVDTQERVLRELVTRGTGVVRYQPSSSALEASYLDLIKDSR
ncbi:MAG TPA: ABC transporter ATP-binding protein [Thermoplasmata archaeon]|nr:ABC transporter ATP-binding protein [Thermoplasmata archaeon]